MKLTCFWMLEVDCFIRFPLFCWMYRLELINGSSTGLSNLWTAHTQQMSKSESDDQRKTILFPAWILLKHPNGARFSVFRCLTLDYIIIISQSHELIKPAAHKNSGAQGFGRDSPWIKSAFELKLHFFPQESLVQQKRASHLSGTFFFSRQLPEALNDTSSMRFGFWLPLVYQQQHLCHGDPSSSFIEGKLVSRRRWYCWYRWQRLEILDDLPFLRSIGF